MRNAGKIFLAACLFSSLSLCVLATPFADHDEKKKRRGKEEISPVSNATYSSQCGACHFVYQPELLPSRSWEKLLSGLKDHFGETIDLVPEDLVTIKTYLTAHAADRSGAERARKIVRSLGRSSTPLRVSEVPYIAKKHHELTSDVFNRPSIQSRGNCIACHKGAGAGIYDDDDVVIPK